MSEGVAPLTSHGVGWIATRIRARLRRHALRAALAAGEDPWASGELMLCAADLMSAATRGRLATSIDGLIRVAEHARPVSPYLRMRRRAVLGEREVLEDIADRLRAPEPAGVVGVALVAQLMSAISSSLLDGDDPHVRGDEWHAAIARCWEALAPASPRSR